MCACVHLREEMAFAAEALLAGAPQKRDVEQLDGGASFEAAIAALCQPDAAHSARFRWGRSADRRRRTRPAERRRVGRRAKTRERRGFEKPGAPQVRASASRIARSPPRAASRALMAASQATRWAPVIDRASSSYGLSTRQPLGLRGGKGTSPKSYARWRSHAIDSSVCPAVPGIGCDISTTQYPDQIQSIP